MAPITPDHERRAPDLEPTRRVGEPRMTPAEKTARLLTVAQKQGKALDQLEALIEEISLIPLVKRDTINKTADAAYMALGQLRFALALELGRIQLGDDHAASLPHPMPPAGAGTTLGVGRDELRAHIPQDR